MKRGHNKEKYKFSRAFLAAKDNKTLISKQEFTSRNVDTEGYLYHQSNLKCKTSTKIPDCEYNSGTSDDAVRNSGNDDGTPSGNNDLSHETDNEAYETDEYSIKAAVQQLRKETARLTSAVKQYADDCMQLQKENEFLLDELKQFYGPDVIAYLESRDPYQIGRSAQCNNPDTGPWDELLFDE